MLRAWARGLASAGLILVMGGVLNAPLLDALVFHGRNTQAIGPHYASSSCHAERCAIQSTARDAPSAPEAIVALRIVSPPERFVPRRSLTDHPASAPSRQNRSRAPPFVA